MTAGKIRILAWSCSIMAIGLGAVIAINADDMRRIMFGLKVYESEPPHLPKTLTRPAVLVFSKTNGFRHRDAIPAANALLVRLSNTNKWSYVITENAAIFTPGQLARFDTVVFNNVSGDVFLPSQRSALRNYLHNGGGFLGIHGSGGDPQYTWRWYGERLIGARFVGHPMLPQLQSANVHIEDPTHPSTRQLPAIWPRTDEWYSFASSPRGRGYHVLMTIDENTYRPGKFFGTGLAMGADHPISWTHCEGKGRVYYNAMGHTAASYSEPAFSRMIEGAIQWTMGLTGDDCTRKDGPR